MGPVSIITFSLSCLCRSQLSFRILDGDQTPPRGPGGPPSMFFSVDGGHSWISGTASQGAYRRHFLALMVGAPGSLTQPPRAPPSTSLSIDRGRSRISVTTSQGASHRCPLVLMVGAPGSPSAPPRGPAVDVF
jgi:hypothetical protein